MRILLIAAVALAAPISLMSAPIQQGRAGAADCVTIGKPKPTATYVIQHSESTGKATTITQVWESVTETGSRMKWTGPAGNWISTVRSQR